MRLEKCCDIPHVDKYNLVMDYKELLREIYKDRLNKFDNDLFIKQYEDYIEKAVQDIDLLWFENIKKFKKGINVVILAEAPMWGNSGSYIYNPKSPETDFFKLKYLGQEHSIKYNSEKEQLIDLLLEKGIVFLDISPFPLNPSKTKVCYRNRSKKHDSILIGTKNYHKIIKESFQTHLKPKLEEIYKVNNKKSPKFAYRYNTVMKMHKVLYEKCRNILPFPEANEVISIAYSGSGKYGAINLDVLNNLI